MGASDKSGRATAVEPVPVSPLRDGIPSADLCDDCPRVGYPTDKTRCLPCPRRAVAVDPPTTDMTRALPGGVMDDSTFSAIEDALDRANAPMIADGKWLNLVQRVEALAAQGTSAGTVETEGLGAKPAGPVLEEDAP